MKQFEVQAIGLEEMTDNEMRSLNGGAIPWGPILKAIGKFIAEAVAAWGISELMDSIFNGDEVPDDWCYWAYGGEIDAAICYGD